MTFQHYGVPCPKGALSLMPCPPALHLGDTLDLLKNSGVSTVVSMLPTDEARELGVAAEASMCAARGIGFVSYPIVDFGLPEIVPFADLIDRLVALLKDEGHVAVHCRAGIGRSGMVAAGMLVALGNNAADAQQIVSGARGVLIPDTVEQGKFVAKFAQHLMRR